MMNIKKIISEMTLEEKAGLCSGSDFWHTKAVERLGIGRLMMSDGPHGLRKQEEKADHLGADESIEAVCFPTGSALAAGFSRGLMQKVGETLARECLAEGVDILLGPAINIKRSPLCGRNFEYLSEDPYVSAQLGAAYINGVQEQGVGTCLKHYAVNNQETRRLTVSAEVDERTLREIYLAAFEDAVKLGKPWSIMNSYNRVNGEYVGQSEYLLQNILREEWGFDGAVITDWGACDDRVKGLAAGQDLEMPGSGDINDRLIIEAVKAGSLDEAVLDTVIERLLVLYQRCVGGRDSSVVFDREADHAIARDAAQECMVLLKNERALLPLTEGQRVAFIGEFAEIPRYQGGGSSHVNAKKVVGALQAADKAGLSVRYAKGYNSGDELPNHAMQAEAVQTAADADIAVVFVGLPEHYETEGLDRRHMRMPENQNALIAAVAAAQPNTVVVLHNGSPVEMPWLDKVPAVLESYLAGEAAGEAQIDLLYGKVNPCGKLAETFPVCLADNPSALNFPGEGDIVRYSEGVYVGYRYYDRAAVSVLFPFGHGLSYTSFTYSDIQLSADHLAGNETLQVTCKVENTGNCAGKEVVQLYIGDTTNTAFRPVKELRGFEKVCLAPGAVQTVTFALSRRDFSWYDEREGSWRAGGAYTIQIGSSSRDIRLTADVQVKPDLSHLPVTANTLIGDLILNPAMLPVLQERLKDPRLPKLVEYLQAGKKDELDMHLAYLHDSPIRGLRNFSNGSFDNEKMQAFIDALNQARLDHQL